MKTTELDTIGTTRYLKGVAVLYSAALHICELAFADPDEIENPQKHRKYFEMVTDSSIAAALGLGSVEFERLCLTAVNANVGSVDIILKRAHNAFLVEKRARDARKKLQNLCTKDDKLHAHINEYIQLCEGILELRRSTGQNDIIKLIDDHKDDTQPVNLVELLNVVLRSQAVFTEEFVGVISDLYPQFGLVPERARRWIERQSQSTQDRGTPPSDGPGKVFFWARQLRPTTTQLQDCEVACRALLFVPAFMQDLASISALHVNDLTHLRTTNPAYTHQILAVWKVARAIDGLVHFDQPMKPTSVSESPPEITLQFRGPPSSKPVTDLEGARNAIIWIGEGYEFFTHSVSDKLNFTVGDVVSQWGPDFVRMIKEFPETLFYTALDEATHDYVESAKKVYEYFHPETAMRREVARQLNAILEPMFEQGYLKRPLKLPTLAEISVKGIGATREFESQVSNLETYTDGDLAGQCAEWLDGKHYANAVNLMRFSNSAVCEVRVLEYPEGPARYRANFLRDYLRTKAREHQPPIMTAEFV